MLEITIPKRELFNEKTNEFEYTDSKVLQLEHSLISLSKWEAKWRKPFLGKDEKTDEETIDYIRCMTITQNVIPEIYLNITSDIIKSIKEYIEHPMSATWFREEPEIAGIHKDVITAEIIYYWMIAQNIPIEWEKRHLNRLLTLIRVCSIKNAPSKNKNKRQSMADRKALNAQRRAQHNTKG